MSRERKILNEKGMLLLEAILAVVILTVSLSVIIESLVSGLRATVFTVDYSKALILVDNVMSDILRQRTVEPSLVDKADFPEPDDAFQYQSKTQEIKEAVTESAFQEAQLTVSWRSGQKEQDVSVTTWLRNVPPTQTP